MGVWQGPWGERVVFEFPIFAAVVYDVQVHHANLSAGGDDCIPVKEFKRGGELLARSFFIKDPDGYRIEMLERHGYCQ